MRIDPYLFFGGTCRDAFLRYAEIFGGEPTLMRMGDAPDSGEGHATPEQADLIIHASLPVGDFMLMGSDDPTGGHEAPRGIMVSVSVPSADEARRVFAALADGGQETQPLIETFFAPVWGMCTDRFGIPWMVGAEPQG